MEEKNQIIVNYSSASMAMANALNITLSQLGDNFNVNMGLIKTAYIELEEIKSQLVILQTELDNYGDVV